MPIYHLLSHPKAQILIVTPRPIFASTPAPNTPIRSGGHMSSNEYLELRDQIFLARGRRTIETFSERVGLTCSSTLSRAQRPWCDKNRR
ncbi:hypothetical protein BDZ94DRAFT_485333 [Collybia nuda]|uniref:Uncharacterized protein n=1 Tax=Collybia nuda TaxID=64659 RepID=A0A9P6CFP0_9AGAR|nr:hypothetical protein BDZ94DRAFT_485333 [Collybia nuda]